jgi:hypothetical protein
MKSLGAIIRANDATAMDGFYLVSEWYYSTRCCAYLFLMLFTEWYSVWWAIASLALLQVERFTVLVVASLTIYRSVFWASFKIPLMMPIGAVFSLCWAV